MAPATTPTKVPASRASRISPDLSEFLHVLEALEAKFASDDAGPDQRH
jgi:hypothetical protein